MPVPAGTVDPFRLAEEGGDVSVEIPVRDLARLGGLLLSSDGRAVATFRFRVDDLGRAVATGSVRASLSVRCQRCLEEMTLDVDASPALVFSRGEARVEDGGEEWETYPVDDDGIGIAGLVEDEILLSLPSSPMHAAGSCEPPGSSVESGTEPPRTVKALAGLAQMMERDRDE